MHVGHHRAHIARRVPARFEVLHRLLAGLVPQERIALVARVDLLAAVGREAHVGMRVDEFAERRVEREALHLALLEAQHELRRCAVHAVAGHHDVVAGAEDVLHSAQRRGREALVHGEDGARAHVAVDVRRAIERVERDAEAARELLRHDDRLLILLGDEDAARARFEERVDKDVVGENVELLLVIATRVLLAVHAEQVGDAGLGARTRGGLACECKLRHEHCELSQSASQYGESRARRSVSTWRGRGWPERCCRHRASVRASLDALARAHLLILRIRHEPLRQRVEVGLAGNIFDRLRGLSSRHSTCTAGGAFIKSLALGRGGRQGVHGAPLRERAISVASSRANREQKFFDEKMYERPF